MNSRSEAMTVWFWGVTNIDNTDRNTLAGDMVWSYSRVTSFDQCKYGWYLKYVEHLEQKPQFYSDYGSFVHRLIEQFYNGELTEGELPIKFLFGFTNEVKGERPSLAIVEKYIQRGLDYFNSFKPFPFEVVAVEKKIEFNIGDHRFVGYIDILGSDNGDLIVVDNKSRDLKPRSNRKEPTENDKLLDKMLRQLYLYSKGIRDEYGRFPKKLCFNCFKAGVFIEEPFREDAYSQALSWAAERIDEIIKTDKFSPNVDYFFCKNLCGFCDECCYWDGGKNLWKSKKRKRG